MRLPIIRLSVVAAAAALTAAFGAVPAHASPIDDGLAVIGDLVPGANQKSKPRDRTTTPTTTPVPSTTTPSTSAPRPTAPETTPRPESGERVDLIDGTSILLPHQASTATKVSMLTDVRERLTAQGMALLNSLMALMPGGNGPSRGTPVLTVTPTTGLKSGATVTVSGTGYKAGENIYVTQTIAKPSSGYPSTYADAKKVTTSGSGTFSTQITVTSTFAKVDCRKTACFVASFTAFPKLADRSQDAWVPISFAAGGPTTPTAPGTTAPGSPTTPVKPRPGAGPSVSVDRTSGLNPAGDTVTVSGTGFSTSGPGVYVGLAQTDQFSVTDQSSFGDQAVWVATSNGRMRGDGSFSVQLPVKAKFARADCTKAACAVYTFAAHGSSDRSQDTATGVSFTGGPAARGVVNVPQDGGASRRGPVPQNSGPSTASASLSTSTIAATGTTAVTVNGTGFATTGPGVYVGVAETGKYSTTDSSVYSPVTWVPSTQISGGSFSVTLEIAPVFAAGNCIENSCAVYTFAAHGSSDRSQDTSSPFTVAGTEEEKARAVTDAKKKAAAPSSTAPSSSTSPTALAGDKTSATPDNAIATGSTTNWWAWGGGAAAVVIAATAGYAAARLRS
ncbi:hypothetical protein nbrc107696_04410 [Gordonia spumicola]|uniref:IPT/TIG domain-containing protein n=1 Tax=Gordonia spumicola TaxID=589161 RepID=A0A7I9V3J7_9ACTN|nr:neocarzinostatin apoprotein domain-containing protein [Gordonia spumicola]GED99994.1 hypothetical protein nbrc107696_04410 [Gordonia spumicola]